jgi:hypothetical protein
MDEEKDRYEKHMERIRAQKRQINAPPYAPPSYSAPYAPPYAPPSYAESQRNKKG